MITSELNTWSLKFMCKALPAVTRIRTHTENLKQGFVIGSMMNDDRKGNLGHIYKIRSSKACSTYKKLKYEFVRENTCNVMEYKCVNVNSGRSFELLDSIHRASDAGVGSSSMPRGGTHKKINEVMRRGCRILQCAFHRGACQEKDGEMRISKQRLQHVTPLLLVSESSVYYTSDQCNLLSLTSDAQISSMGPPTAPYAVLQINFKSPHGKEVRVVAKADSEEVPFDLIIIRYLCTSSDVGVQPHWLALVKRLQDTFPLPKTSAVSTSLNGLGNFLYENELCYLKIVVACTGLVIVINRFIEMALPTAEFIPESLNFAVSFGQAQEPLSDICDSAWSRSSSISEGTTLSPWGLTTAGASASSTGPYTKKVLNSAFSTQITEVFKMVDPQQNSLIILQPSTIGLALNNIKSRWIDYARTLYNFQHCSKVSPNAEESAKKCFQLLAATAGITQDDEAVVVYFQKALSQRTLQNICHPIRAPSGIPVSYSSQ
ncbi:hypothetical protein ACTXT7_001040 [Hymenolepis weldensis]